MKIMKGFYQILYKIHFSNNLYKIFIFINKNQSSEHRVQETF